MLRHSVGSDRRYRVYALVYDSMVRIYDPTTFCGAERVRPVIDGRLYFSYKYSYRTEPVFGGYQGGGTARGAMAGHLLPTLKLKGSTQYGLILTPMDEEAGYPGHGGRSIRIAGYLGDDEAQIDISIISPNCTRMTKCEPEPRSRRPFRTGSAPPA